jgi:hypothetical protein
MVFIAGMRRSLEGVKLLGVIVAATLVLASACGSGARHAKLTSRQGVSHFAVTDFRLLPPGVVFELHPTVSPIVVEAAADAPLKVCQFGTSFAGAWIGGCRPLRDRPISLPPTNGFIHAAFRIRSMTGQATRVTHLSLRWHCVDHEFGLFRGRTQTPVAHPVFDC